MVKLYKLPQNVQQTSLHGLDIKNYFETHQISHTLRPWDIFNIWRVPQRIFINLMKIVEITQMTKIKYV